MTPRTMDFEVLEDPYKSPNDKKDYRVVKLSNGLTALLVSDLHSLKEANLTISTSSDASDRKNDVMDLEDSMDDEEEIGTSNDEDEFDSEDGNESPRSEESIMKTKSRKNRYLAAASLCIRVGSFEDPRDIQGLMHFLEHMVFMGSEKYPKENCFDNFIKKSGGSDNAQTDYEYSTFYFDVQEVHFEKSLDMFAQFFISPLMKKEAMLRERKAIHSEFQESVNDDDCRKKQLLSSLAVDGHPMALFSFGNEETLQLQISDSELHSKLHDVRTRFYSAHYMTLAVQAREPLEKLQDLVVKIFSKIPKNHLDPPKYEKFGQPFVQETFHKLYEVIPVNDAHLLDISWALPCLLQYYEYKPLHYISHLIGHEGLGSILSYFKKRLWAVGIYAGNDESGSEHNSTYALFHIRIHLTNDGFTHLREVLLVVFQYLKLLKNMGPIERIFTEIQKMEQIDFDYAEENRPYDNVETLSEDMQLYPSKYYLTGSALIFKYNPDLIEHCLSMLTPATCNVMISSKQYENQNVCFETEHWFGTKYCANDFPREWEIAWENLALNEDLYLPEPNPFIPDDFAIPNPTDCISKYPICVLSDYKGELWFKPDFKFNLPRAYCYIYFYFDMMRNSAKMGAMLDLFLNLYQQQIMETLYPATVAQYESSIAADDWGFTIQVNGFNQRLGKVIEMLMNQMRIFLNYLNEEKFVQMKEQQMKCYHNGILSPNTLRRDMRLVLLQEIHWQVVEKMDALRDISLSEFQNEFVKEISIHKYIRTLIQGNITEEEAKNIHNLVTDGCLEEHAGKCPEMRTRKCPPGDWVIRVNGVNPASANTSVVNYYQGDTGNLFSELLNELVIMAMSEPVFDTLRTKDQLGYHIYCTNRNTYGILGISITVNSQANKYSINHIDERMEAFLRIFSENMKNMAEKEMTSLKDTLTSHKMTVDHTLKEEVDRNWNEIIMGQFLFDRYEQQIKLIPNITTGAASQYLTNLVSPSNPNYRKLSIQVVGAANPEEGTAPRHEETFVNGNGNLPKHLGPSDEDIQSGRTENNFISHLREFHKKMTFYPITKVIRKIPKLI